MVEIRETIINQPVFLQLPLGRLNFSSTAITILLRFRFRTRCYPFQQHPSHHRCPSSTFGLVEELTAEAEALGLSFGPGLDLSGFVRRHPTSIALSPGSFLL